MRMNGGTTDDVRWDPAGPDFDAQAMEAAIRAGRREAYAPLADLAPTAAPGLAADALPDATAA